MEKLLLTYFWKRMPIVFALDRCPAAQITKKLFVCLFGMLSCLLWIRLLQQPETAFADPAISVTFIAPENMITAYFPEEGSLVLFRGQGWTLVGVVFTTLALAWHTGMHNEVPIVAFEQRHRFLVGCLALTNAELFSPVRCMGFTTVGMINTEGPKLCNILLPRLSNFLPFLCSRLTCTGMPREKHQHSPRFCKVEPAHLWKRANHDLSSNNNSWCPGWHEDITGARFEEKSLWDPVRTRVTCSTTWLVWATNPVSIGNFIFFLWWEKLGDLFFPTTLVFFTGK